MSVIHRIALTFAGTAGAVAAAALVMAPAAGAQSMSATPFISHFHTTTTIASTVPANGDVNPYGVAVIGQSTGNLHRGNVLVSNFNNGQNQQGTGTTIVEVSPGGTVTQFAGINAATLPGACPGGVGLTTALSVLPGGWVVVGSLPTTDGTSATASAGCLIVLDSHGNVRETISGHGINGPWDMTAASEGNIAELFVTNVLNGTKAANGNVTNHGTVLRLVLVLGDNHPPKLVAVTTIGSGFPEKTDPAALVVGPTGVSLDSHGTLFVADSVANRIAAIPFAPFRLSSAGTGQTVTSGGALNTPLGLAVAPNGDVLTVNAADGFLVETTPGGKQVATHLLDNSVPSPQTNPPTPPGAGALFGLAVAPYGTGVYYVDDATNTFALLH
jgi:hypothetical protein